MKSATVAQHPFVEELERHFPRIRAELDRLDLERDFLDWPQRESYHGIWRVYPLFFPAGPYLDVDVEHNRARCPETTRVTGRLGGMQGAGFSLLGPHSSVQPHRDHYAPGVLRCHLALCVPTGSRMRLGDRWLAWDEGRCLVFDGQVEHEAINDSPSARIVLLVDVLAPGTPDACSVGS